jgi:hypothetical protein
MTKLKPSVTNIIIPMVALPSLLARTKLKPNKNAVSLALYLLVRFSYSANSLALVIINIVLCGVAFVCFGEFGTETQQSTNDFDANGNLLHLDNIANLDWYQCHHRDNNVRN